MLTATRNEILESLAANAEEVIAMARVLDDNTTIRMSCGSVIRKEIAGVAEHAEWLARNFKVEG